MTPSGGVARNSAASAAGQRRAGDADDGGACRVHAGLSRPSGDAGAALARTASQKRAGGGDIGEAAGAQPVERRLALAAVEAGDCDWKAANSGTRRCSRSHSPRADPPS